MSVYIFLLITFAVSVALSMIFGSKRYRSIAFLFLLPLAWAIVCAAPSRPPLLDVKGIWGGVQDIGATIGLDSDARYRYEEIWFGKKRAEERMKAREADYQRSQREKKPDDRATSWAPFLLSLALAGVWTAFAPLYTVFSVVAQARSNSFSRENNDFIRWTIGIIVVYLLFKFKWLRGNDGNNLRRSVEYFGLHMFYNWLLK